MKRTFVESDLEEIALSWFQELGYSVIQPRWPTTSGAWNQFQTYKKDISSLFVYNEVLVVSDGLDARIGSLTAGVDRFMPWRTVDGKTSRALHPPSSGTEWFGSHSRSW